MFRFTLALTVILGCFCIPQSYAGGEPTRIYDKELAELTVFEDQAIPTALLTETPRASNTFCIWVNGKIIATGSTIPTDPHGESHPLASTSSSSELTVQTTTHSDPLPLITDNLSESCSWLRWGIGSAAVVTAGAIIARFFLPKR